MHIPIIMAVWYAVLARRRGHNPWTWGLWGAAASFGVTVVIGVLGFAASIALLGKNRPWFIELNRLGDRGMVGFIAAVTLVSIAVSAYLGHRAARGRSLERTVANLFIVAGAVIAPTVALWR